MKTIDKLIIKIFFVAMMVIVLQLVNPFSVNAAFYCSGGDCWYTVCSKNSDCGVSGFTGEQFCQNNNLYQNYETHTCNNQGSTNSNCTNSKNPQLIQTCNGKCEAGLWYIGCSVGNATTTNTQNNTNTTNNSYNQNTNYISHSIKGCINNSVYWYDSLGNQQELYQNCGINGQICQDGRCIGQPYTQPEQKPVLQPPLKPSYKTSKDLIISIFGKKASEPLQWEKNVSAVNNDKIEFLLTVKNIFNLPIDNVSVKVNVTDSIRYTDNLKIDNVASDKDIVSGFNLGTIPQKTSKSLSFTGVFQSQDTIKEGIKITGIVVADSISDSDFFTINMSNIESNQSQINLNTAAIGNSSILNFAKKWYVWLIIIAVLIFLFIVIFRRLSSNV